MRIPAQRSWASIESNLSNSKPFQRASRSARVGVKIQHRLLSFILLKNDGIHSLLNADVMTVSGARAADPEVVATAQRRRFSANDKRPSWAEADACMQPGELGALMRREAVYSSMLSTWRKQRDQSQQAALEPRKHGRKPEPAREEHARIERLERENARLQRELTVSVSFTGTTINTAIVAFR